MHTSATERVVLVMRRQLSRSGAEYVAVIVLTLLAAREAIGMQAYGGPLDRTTAIALGVLALVPIALSRTWPLLAAALAVLLTVTVLRTENPALTVMSICITLYLLAYLVMRRGLPLAGPFLIPFFVIAAVRLPDSQNALGDSAPLLFCVAALAVGESLRRSTLAVAALGVSEDAIAESNRAQTVMEERARIARELHDIVAHHLSVIAVESEVVRLTSPALPQSAGERLESIAATAREALNETRRLLGVLREDAGVESERVPQPGLAELGHLIDKAETTGTHVRFILEGKAAPLPRSTDLAAYRIVQEALTNARRHAPGADVEVDVAYDKQCVHLRVRDYGPGAPDGEPVEGHGLMGMRERATLAGGTFSVGQAEGGGFEVDVLLPINEAAS